MTSGVLLLDKPAGLSSNAALQRVRRLYGADKAGHVGSLDPLATGMLPICLGEATKVAGELLGGRKCYRFAVLLGTRTSTGDLEGEVIETAPVAPLERAAVTAVLAAFCGRQAQTPPMYSALKHGGQPLYRLARAGLEVERAAREIEVFSLQLLKLEPRSLELQVVCSKGTYVRTLAEDVARALGSCGHVGSLRRLYVEPFAEEHMKELAQLEADAARGALPPLTPADRVLPGMEAVAVPAAEASRLLHGQPVTLARCSARGRVRLYDERGRFLGLGEADGAGGVRPKRLFLDA